MCEINNGRKHTMSGLSNRRDKTGQYDIEEMEVSNKEAGEEMDEEEHYDSNSDSDSHEKNTPLLRPTKKRPRLAAGEKLLAKRATKRGRFSSSLS